MPKLESAVLAETRLMGADLTGAKLTGPTSRMRRPAAEFCAARSLQAPTWPHHLRQANLYEASSTARTYRATSCGWDDGARRAQ